LTLRALHQSARFERGWKLLSGTFKRTCAFRSICSANPVQTDHAFRSKLITPLGAQRRGLVL
jgi:hypothetical protein